jgi:hypothetical protein
MRRKDGNDGVQEGRQNGKGLHTTQGRQNEDRIILLLRNHSSAFLHIFPSSSKHIKERTRAMNDKTYD